MKHQKKKNYCSQKQIEIVDIFIINYIKNLHQLLKVKRRHTKNQKNFKIPLLPQKIKTSKKKNISMQNQKVKILFFFLLNLLLLILYFLFFFI